MLKEEKELGEIQPCSESLIMKKKFKDLFGREIEVGDTVLNVWANTDTYRQRGQGGEGVVQWRIATVIKLCPSSIRIEYDHEGEKRDCSIYKTQNRIIRMSNNGDITSDVHSERLLNEQKKKVRRLEKNLLETTQDLNRANSKIATMRVKIHNLDQEMIEHKKHLERFNLLDL